MKVKSVYISTRGMLFLKRLLHLPLKKSVQYCKKLDTPAWTGHVSRITTPADVVVRGQGSDWICESVIPRAMPQLKHKLAFECHIGTQKVHILNNVTSIPKKQYPAARSRCIKPFNANLKANNAWAGIWCKATYIWSSWFKTLCKPLWHL